MGQPRSFISLLTGCFAMPAAENPTVVMIEAAYRNHGLDARYRTCEVAPAAARRRGGENTDGQGFLTALRTVIDPAGRRVVLFGAGGAARSIVTPGRVMIGSR